MIFSLPQHRLRYYRPTVIKVLGLTNAELWDAFVFYGITAMIGYFPRGILTDHFSAGSSCENCWIGCLYVTWLQ